MILVVATSMQVIRLVKSWKLVPREAVAITNPDKLLGYSRDSTVYFVWSHDGHDKDLKNVAYPRFPDIHTVSIY